MKDLLSKYNCSEIKELVLKGELEIGSFTEKELNVFTDHLLDTFDPDSVSDTILLEQCYTALEVYTDIGKSIPTERYDAMAKSVIGTFRHRASRKSSKKLIILVAAVIAILALTGCSIIGFIVFDVLNLGKDLLDLEENVSKVQGDIEIVRTDDYISYDTIDDLADELEIDGIDYKKIPADYEFRSAAVYGGDENKCVVITYSNNQEDTITIIIYINNTHISDDEYIDINGDRVYLSIIDLGYQASWVHSGDLYNIQCSDKNYLIELIKNIKET